MDELLKNPRTVSLTLLAVQCGALFIVMKRVCIHVPVCGLLNAVGQIENMYTILLEAGPYCGVSHICRWSCSEGEADQPDTFHFCTAKESRVPGG